MTDHPEVRDCRTCSEFVLDDRGQISTYTGADADGNEAELPMRRAEAGVPPPCVVCPKVPDGEEARPQAEEDDYNPWFWGVRQLFLEGRAIGDHGDPDPMMRQLFVEFDQAERRQERYDLVSMVTLAAARMEARRR